MNNKNLPKSISEEIISNFENAEKITVEQKLKNIRKMDIETAEYLKKLYNLI
jgi:hypothetical protein